MSYSLLDETAQLRWWTEDELEFRDVAVKTLHRTIQTTLRDINKAWVFQRTEGPMLVPRHMVAPGYTDDDLWTVKADIASQDATMRPETTSSSYMAARHIIGTGSEKDQQKKLPLCVWQVGKSYRREKSDGANAAKLRFFEFTQAEWQCIYGLNTMADYRAVIMPALLDKISWLTDRETRIVPSDRLPGYSLRTDDIEVDFNGRWTEVASISTRTDFEGAQVLEIAIGIDRVVDVATKRVV
jgi:glycyl-tRNA synthetase